MGHAHPENPEVKAKQRNETLPLAPFNRDVLYKISKCKKVVQHASLARTTTAISLLLQMTRRIVKA